MGKKKKKYADDHGDEEEVKKGGKKKKKNADDYSDEEEVKKGGKKKKKYDDDYSDEEELRKGSKKKKKKKYDDYSDEEDKPRKKAEKTKKKYQYSDSEEDRGRKKKTTRHYSDESQDSFDDRRRKKKYDDDNDRKRSRRNQRSNSRGRGGGRNDRSRSFSRRYPGVYRHEFQRVAGNSGRCDQKTVDKILSQRIEAKRSNDYQTADVLRDKLRELGVEVLDRERQWWVIGGGGRPRYGPGSHDYRRIGLDDDENQIDEGHVNQLLAERLQARITRDFVTADRLRDKLRDIGVEVDDKEKTWTARRQGYSARGRTRDTSRSRSPRRRSSNSRSMSPRNHRQASPRRSSASSAER